MLLFGRRSVRAGTRTAWALSSAFRPYAVTHCFRRSKLPRQVHSLTATPRSRASSKPFSCTVCSISDEASALRRLYHIETPPDIQRAADLAKHHAYYLNRWSSARPIADHTLAAFRSMVEWRKDRSSRPLILDSGCGSGRSAAKLAKMFPTHDIIAIDKNESALRKSPLRPRLRMRTRSPDVGLTNIKMVRADLIDFWRLAHGEKWELDMHFLLFPNPYPKPANIKSRFYGHPVFPIMLSLGGIIEVRASWEAYCVEFAAAVEALAPNALIEGPALYHLDSAESALSNFEAKYHACGHSVYRLRVQVPKSLHIA